MDNNIVKIVIKITKFIFVAAISLLIMVQIFQRVIPESDGFLGFRTFIIVSASMEPKIHKGDVILVRNKNPKDIKAGDIISYQGESSEYKNKIITHQVTNIMTEDKKFIFYTKGLKNQSIDPAVYEDQVYGVMVYKFFFLSLISKIIRNPIGFTIFVIVPLIIMFFSEIKSVFKEIEERR